MKIALVGDIHANLPALEAVLAHARKRSVERVWNLGDSVGYGPFPEQVIQLLRNEKIISLTGNYDTKVLNFPANRKKFRKSKHPEKYLAFKWAYENLSKVSRSFMDSLPQEMAISLCGNNFYLTHGSTSSIEEPFTPSTPKTHFKHLAKRAAKHFPQEKRVHFLIFGHSHQPFTCQAFGIWFINPGSIGRADDGDPRASYMILELENSKVQIYPYRISYDLQRTIDAIHQHNLPESFTQMFIKGYNLDTIEKLNGIDPR